MPEPNGRWTPRGAAGSGPHGGWTTDPRAGLLSERVVMLGSAVDDDSANDVTVRLLHLAHSEPGRDIQLYINSPGGSLSAMSAIHDTMRFVECDVQTVCLGRAGSVAAVLLAAGTPGKRMALPGAVMTLEQPTAELAGRPADLVRGSAELRRHHEAMEELLAGYTGRSAESVRGDLERVTVLDGEGAVGYGLVDHVVRSRRAGSGGSWDAPARDGR